MFEIHLCYYSQNSAVKTRQFLTRKAPTNTNYRNNNKHYQSFLKIVIVSFISIFIMSSNFFIFIQSLNIQKISFVYSISCSLDEVFAKFFLYIEHYTILIKQWQSLYSFVENKFISTD